MVIKSKTTSDSSGARKDAEAKTRPTNPRESVDADRVVSPNASMADLPKQEELTLRPRSLEEYVGQESLKRHIRISIDSAKIRNTSMEHLLFYGPPGLGKTTIAMIIASEMGVNIRHTSGPAIEKPADLISILSSIEEREVLFIDEIHRLKPALEEILYGAMEDFVLDIMVGSGTGATSVRMDIPRFTLVGATTKLSNLSNPLRDRFGNIVKLDFYTPDELERIVHRSLSILGSSAPKKGIARQIAERSRGTPRIANRYVKIFRDYETVGHDLSQAEGADEVFSHIGVDERGLDRLDREFLHHLVHTFRGNPVGLSTIASIVGEEEGTLEDVVEPYLLKIGFLERTPRGRKITPSGETYVRERA